MTQIKQLEQQSIVKQTDKYDSLKRSDKQVAQVSVSVTNQIDIFGEANTEESLLKMTETLEGLAKCGNWKHSLYSKAEKQRQKLISELCT